MELLDRLKIFFRTNVSSEKNSLASQRWRTCFLFDKFMTTFSIFVPKVFFCQQSWVWLVGTFICTETFPRLGLFSEVSRRISHHLTSIFLPQKRCWFWYFDKAHAEVVLLAQWWDIYMHRDFPQIGSFQGDKLGGESRVTPILATLLVSDPDVTGYVVFFCKWNLKCKFLSLA